MRHLKRWRVDERGWALLVSKINQILETCSTSETLIVKFAEKCYSKASDRELAAKHSKVFLEAVFGNIDTLLLEGPEAAVDIVVFGCKKQKPLWKVKYRLKHYKVGPTLGNGTNSEVKLGWNLEQKKEVALKIMKLSTRNSRYALAENSMIKNLNHRNIIEVYEIFETVRLDNRKTTVLAIEYARNGDLIDYVVYTPKFDDKLARWFFSSLVEGVEYCHSKNIIHRDLKYDNCLLGENFVLKISDFGFATYYYNEMMSTSIGTRQYAAPEVLAEDQYTDAVDIFSMGVMLFIAISGSLPWRLANHRKDKWYRWVHNGKWDEFFQYHERRKHKFTEEQKTILMGLLEPNPKRRWRFENIKKSKWYQGQRITQCNVASQMRRRKRLVDEKKFKAMKARPEANRKAMAMDIFSKKFPDIYFQPIPALSLITDERAEWVLDDIANVIIGKLMGTIENMDKNNYKITFRVNKLVDTGRYIDKKTRKKELEKVRVAGSVQMWTIQGQQEFLDTRASFFKAVCEDKQNLTKQQKEMLHQNNIPIIKSLAVFRSEGGSEAKYLFPSIYSDILEGLPVDIISKDAYNDDMEEKSISKML